jgi:tetratricopeptide (TPR) repeat protein
MIFTISGQQQLRHVIFYHFVFLTVLASSPVKSQDRDRARAQEYAQQQEQSKKAAILREYDSAIFLIEQEKFARADEKFRYVLANLKSVPSELTYHFGKNSFLLGKHKQSIDWLNKYIQLKGTNGQFYNDAIAWKAKAEEAYLKEKTKQAEQVHQVMSSDYDIDCGPTGKIACPVCKGQHVIIKKGAFGNEYKTCPYCDDHGILTCEEYNKLLRGTLAPKF